MLEKIISIGIDIGTSTTQVVFSEITIENMASGFTVPRINIIDKKVIYKSDIYLTPLISQTEIDGEKIKIIIEAEYQKAKISKTMVSTGAVIITGETARKENASLISEQLSDFAGDFVVATAGPDLESIIAGKGAGAAKLSKEKNAVVINFDIGGGTTNISVFDSGEVIDTACFDIGGRLIVFNQEKKVSYVSKKIKKLAAEIGIRVEENILITQSDLEKIAEKMADILAEIIIAGEKNDLYKYLITNHDLKRDYNIDYISFSGGVADYIKNDSKDMDIYKFNDLGIILARKISESKLFKSHNVFKADETIRATVVGAGSHTTNISGSTITYTDDIFPLKNIPIIKINKAEENSSAEEMIKTIKRKLDWFDLEEGSQTVALALAGKKNFTFKEIQKLAEIIINGMQVIIEKNFPLIIILENDAAKVLGQTINKILSKKENIVSVDSIKVSNGDYIDIGKPLAKGKVLPVIIKTLIFGK
ncbi:MAG: ethanolamine ammonia-lyase reactivating factor EutA [bacterium]